MKSHGMKLAVNTNKVAQAAIELCNHYFPSTFDYVCGSCPQMPVKPSPDGVYKILHHFNLHKEDAVFGNLKKAKRTKTRQRFNVSEEFGSWVYKVQNARLKDNKV